MVFVVFFIAGFVFYLALTAGSGDAFLWWSLEELIIGGGVGVLVSVFFSSIAPRKIPLRLLNPLNWLLFLIYIIGPFLLSLTLANFEVVMRVITGRFKPALVKVKTGLESETGTVVLANSITLTPGTLTVDMDAENHDLYIHCLEWKKVEGVEATPKDVSGPMHSWVKKIFG